MSCCTPPKKEQVILKSEVKENKEQNAIEVFLSYKIERKENVRGQNKKNNKGLR
jgi:hypothetical protein